MMRSVLALLMLSFDTASSATSYAIVTPNYKVVGNGSPDELTKLATRFEIVRGLLEGQVGRIPPPNPGKQLTFLVVGDPEDVQRLCGQRCSAEVIGFSRSTDLGSIAVIPRNAIGSGNYDGQYVLFGMAARDAVARKFPPNAPQWLQLGWAEMVASTNFARPGKLPLGNVQIFRRLQSRQLRWSNLAAILDGTATSAKDDRLDGQAMMLIHYLLFTPARRGQLGAYTAAIMAGKTGAEAAYAFGDLGKLGSELRAYDDLNGLMVRTLSAPPSPAGIAKKEIPDAEARALEAAVTAGSR